MRRSITVMLTMMLAVGMLAGFAGPVAAQDVSNSADATVDQDQTNVQVSEQNAEVKGDKNTVEQTNVQVSEQSQEGTAVAVAEQDISVDVDVDDDDGPPFGQGPDGEGPPGQN